MNVDAVFTIENLVLPLFHSTETPLLSHHFDWSVCCSNKLIDWLAPHTYTFRHSDRVIWNASLNVYFGFSLQRYLLTKTVWVFLKWTSAGIPYNVPVKILLLFSPTRYASHELFSNFSRTRNLCISPQNFSSKLFYQLV